MRVEIGKYIVIDTEICHGQPTFKGTRIMVSIILEMLAAGCSEKEILKAYPSLSKEHITAALEFAAKISERKYVEIPIG
jgi:uncharacterized protein (DUF433 family)